MIIPSFAVDRTERPEPIASVNVVSDKLNATVRKAAQYAAGMLTAGRGLASAVVAAQSHIGQLRFTTGRSFRLGATTDVVGIVVLSVWK